MTTVIVTGAAVIGTDLHAPHQLLPGCGSPAPGGDPADPARVLGPRGLRYKDRATCLALAAAQLALTDAGLPGAAAETPDDCGVVVSSNHGNLDTVCDAAATIAEHGTDGLSPMALPNASSNIAASSVAIRFRLAGPNLTLCNGPTSGLDAVHWARRLIAAGRARRVLVIGTESDTAALRAVTGAEGPLFDGAAAVVLEAADSARRRSAAGRAVIGPYARAATPEQSLRALGTLPPVALWLSSRTAVGDPPAGAGQAPVHDLNQLLGDASGALGVLQCAAAASLPPSSGATLALAGDTGHDAVATLLFEPSENAA
jgi:3-oxoacyl-[acyl-carrier-protein] synthase II